MAHDLKKQKEVFLEEFLLSILENKSEYYLYSVADLNVGSVRILFS